MNIHCKYVYLQLVIGTMFTAFTVLVTYSVLFLFLFNIKINYTYIESYCCHVIKLLFQLYSQL